MPGTSALDRALKFLEGGPAFQDETAARLKPHEDSSHHGRRQNNAKSAPPSSFRHNRKCGVCRHRERAEIERQFLHWRSAESIASEYGIAHHSSIYRHAHATGLFARRATHLRLALSPIIEQAVVVPVTADSIVRAVALCARLNDEGEWVNPPTHVVHHSSKPDASRPFPKPRRRNRSQAGKAGPSPKRPEVLNVAPDGHDERRRLSRRVHPRDSDREARQPSDAFPSAESAPPPAARTSPNRENAPSVP